MFFSSKRTYLVIILLLALVLRIWGIGFGLPHIQHNDEGSLVHTGLFMAAERGRPNVYVHGTIFPGIIAVFSGIYYLTGKWFGLFTDQLDFLVSYIEDPSTIVLFGRLVNSIFSVATVWLVYRAGERFFLRRAGVYASLFLAVSVLHVKESHYVKPDILTGLISILVFLVSLFISRKGGLVFYIIGGLLVGLGVATKFSMILLFPTVLIAHLFNIFREKKGWILSALIDKRLVVLMMTWLLTFFLVSPYVFVDTRFFVSDVLRWKETLDLSRGYPHSPLWYYIFEYLREGLGIGVWIFSIIGSGVAVYNLKKPKYGLLLVFPLLFLATVNIWSKEHVQRYSLPVVPYFALLAGLGLTKLVEFFSDKRLSKTILILGIGLLIWQSFVRSVKFDYLLTRDHTGEMATKWIEKNIKEETSIALEGTLRPYYHPNHGPYLYLSEEAFRKIRESVEFDEDIGRVLRAIEILSINKIGYDILATPNLSYKYDPENSEWDLEKHGLIESGDFYLEKEIEFLVANVWASSGNYKWSEEFSSSLEAEYKVVKRFEPTTDFKYEPHVSRVDYEALDRVELFNPEQIFGPRLTVYKQR
jgi:hypothetical protein